MPEFPQTWPPEMRAKILDLVENRLPDIIELPESMKAPISDLPHANKVRQFVLPLFQIGGFNGKLLAALKIVLGMEADGAFNKDSIVVAASSGNAALNFAILLKRMIGVKEFIAVVEKNTSAGKQAQLRHAKATVKLVPDKRTPIQYAHDLAQEHGFVEINQYTDRRSVEAQEWIAKHVAKQMKAMGKIPSVFVAAAGTTATLVGGARYLKQYFPGIKILGVASPSAEDKVPGSRTVEGLEETGFNYRDAIDYDLVLCGKQEAEEMSEELFGQDLNSAGPTSGQTVAGFNKFFRMMSSEGRTKELENEQGEIVPLYLFMDTFLPYGS